MNRTCVKCTSVLDKTTISDVEVDLCPSCGGLWLDAGELERIGKSPDGDVDKLREALLGSMFPDPPSETTTSCPACDGKLNEVKLGPVTIDYCNKCDGLFLDKGELDQALRAVGGWTLKQLLSAASRATGERPALTV